MYKKLEYLFLIAAAKAIKYFFSWIPKIQRFIDIQIRNRKVYDFKSKPSDIFIVTYPKSGTTWMQSILFQLLTDGDINKIEHILKFSPHLEEDLISANSVPSPRVLKTHLKPRDIDINTSAKYIYILRNGLDVAVSYYDYMNSITNYNKPFDQFYLKFMSGKVPYGSWFDHGSEWLSEKDRENIIFLTYEELKSDIESQVVKIANFLNITIDQEDLTRILSRVSFEYMKENEDKFCIKKYKISKLLGQNSFINKGEVGRGKLISEEQTNIFYAKSKKLNIEASIESLSAR